MPGVDFKHFMPALANMVVRRSNIDKTNDVRWMTATQTDHRPQAKRGRAQPNQPIWQSEIWKKLRAVARRKIGTKPKPIIKSETGRSAMSKAFNEAKKRRKGGSARGKEKYSSGEKGGNGRVV